MEEPCVELMLISHQLEVTLARCVTWKTACYIITSLLIHCITNEASLGQTPSDLLCNQCFKFSNCKVPLWTVRIMVWFWTVINALVIEFGIGNSDCKGMLTECIYLWKKIGCSLSCSECEGIRIMRILNARARVHCIWDKCSLQGTWNVKRAFLIGQMRK